MRIKIQQQEEQKSVQQAFDEFIRYCKVKNLAKDSIIFYENRFILRNVTWGQRERFSDGKVSVGYSTSSATKRVRTQKKLLLTITEWDERLWITLLYTATLQRNGRIVFRFNKCNLRFTRA